MVSPVVVTLSPGIIILSVPCLDEADVRALDEVVFDCLVIVNFTDVSETGVVLVTCATLPTLAVPSSPVVADVNIEGSLDGSVGSPDVVNASAGDA